MEQNEREHLALYSSNCKRCSYLDPDEEKRFSCHYTKGNKFCPAQDIQIVIVGKAQQYAQQVKAARLKRDAKAEARILKVVSAKSQAFTERFYHFLEDTKK